MKKRGLFFLIVFCCVASIYGIDIRVSTHDISIHLTDSMMTADIHEWINDYSYNSVIEEYPVTWEIVNNIPYISFNYNGTFMDVYNAPKVLHGNKKYLVLFSSNFLFFYDENNNIVYSLVSGLVSIVYSYSSTDTYHERRNVPSSVSISASTELKENDTFYSAANLLLSNKLIPYAEGVSGSGIGEKIRIESRKTDNRFDAIYSLYISNGFIDYNRPHLFEYNNRLKKVRVHHIETNEYKDFDLQDTPNIQEFVLNFNSRAPIIEIEILEVYKGTRWDDTCVNLLIPGLFEMR
ncbi:MAG TPA: hypothetical protein DEQ14_03320 [Treponema sp.]|nr:hypothetical protein [Treponema sp.]